MQNIFGQLNSGPNSYYFFKEVETCEFIDTFRPELKRHGYQGIFSPKSRAKSMHENDSRNVDGCAIFWKQDKFQVCPYICRYTENLTDCKHKFSATGRTFNRI